MRMSMTDKKTDESVEMFYTNINEAYRRSER